MTNASGARGSSPEIEKKDKWILVILRGEETRESHLKKKEENLLAMISFVECPVKFLVWA